MFVSLSDNKYQILISSIIGFIFYYYTRNDIYSIGVVLLLSLILRKIEIDKKINEKLVK